MIKEIIKYVKKNFRIILVQMVGPFFGLMSFGIYSIYKFSAGPDAAIDYPFAITLSLAITLLINIPGTALIISENQEKLSNEVTTSLELVEELISGESESFRTWTKALMERRFRIRQIDPTEITHEISLSLQNSDIVRNTYVNLQHITGPSTNGGRNMSDLYANFLNERKESVWMDIVGVDDFLGGRFHQVATKIGNNFGTHEINIISDSIPILNFILIGKEGAIREVYFGWLQNDSPQAEVYHSKDPRMINLFNRYFKLLVSYKKDRLIVDYNLEPTSIFEKFVVEKIRGNWLSVSTSNSLQKPEDYTRYSIISIAVDHGRWSVTGTVYERKTRKIIHEITNISASIFDTGVFYRFERSNADGMNLKKGHGTYTLTASDKDIAIGVYVVLDDSKGPVHNLRAVKINNGLISDTPTITDSEVSRLIERIHASKKMGV